MPPRAKKSLRTKMSPRSAPPIPAEQQPTPIEPPPQPPEGIQLGATSQADKSGGHCVTFALYVPGKKSVHVMGDFNGWDKCADPLHSTPGGLWWLQKPFPPGAHPYQYVVEGEIVICDPFARILAEDASCHPPRAVIRVGQKPFQWNHDDWKRPQLHELILYELHVGDFTPEGTLAAAITRLDYLQNLGINAIELMPIFEFNGGQGWGYNPTYFFTVEQSYGTPDDLRRLIDEAHARGIAVILDIVLAHTAQNHPFNALYPYAESPWYGRGYGEQNQFGFPALDYTRGPAQDFARDVQSFWLREFHLDGFRYDYLHGIGIEGLTPLVNAARQVRPDAFLIGEFLPEFPAAFKNCALDALWHCSLCFALKAMLFEGESNGFHWDDFDRCIQTLDPQAQGYEEGPRMINYLESHDEGRVVHQRLEAGVDEQTALRKAALGAVVLFTMPGEPMLYHGQEWGDPSPRKVGERAPIRWDRLETPAGHALFEHHQRLCRLRRTHPALQTGGFSLDASYPDQKSIVYHRWNAEGDEVVVAVNFSPVPQTLRVPVPRSGLWQEVLQGREFNVEGTEVDYQLEASGAAILVRAPVSGPA